MLFAQSSGILDCVRLNWTKSVGKSRNVVERLKSVTESVVIAQLRSGSRWRSPQSFAKLDEVGAVVECDSGDQSKQLCSAYLKIAACEESAIVRLADAGSGAGDQ
jgi:hypothetical protein